MPAPSTAPPFVGRRERDEDAGKGVDPGHGGKPTLDRAATGWDDVTGFGTPTAALLNLH